MNPIRSSRLRRSCATVSGPLYEQAFPTETPGKACFCKRLFLGPWKKIIPHLACLWLRHLRSIRRHISRYAPVYAPWRRTHIRRHIVELFVSMTLSRSYPNVASTCLPAFTETIKKTTSGVKRSPLRSGCVNGNRAGLVDARSGSGHHMTQNPQTCQVNYVQCGGPAAG